MTRAEWVALLLSGDPDAIAARIEAREERLADLEWCRSNPRFTPPQVTTYRVSGYRRIRNPMRYLLR